MLRERKPIRLGDFSFTVIFKTWSCSCHRWNSSGFPWPEGKTPVLTECRDRGHWFWPTSPPHVWPDQPLASRISEHLCLLCLLILWRPSSPLAWWVAPGNLLLARCICFLQWWPHALRLWDSGASEAGVCDCNVEVRGGCPPTRWGVAVGQ